MYLLQPPLPARCDKMSVFKWSKAGLNSELSFSKTSYLSKNKKTIFFLLFPHSWDGGSEKAQVKLKQYRPGFELE